MPLGIRVIDRIIDQADVSITNVQNSDVLAYNSTTQKWENRAFAGGGGPHTHPWTDINSTPTTLAGYGITDAAALIHTHAWASITSTPTTLSGYGITDAAPLVHTHDWASITSTPTTLSGYGITDAASSSHNHDGVYSPLVGSTSLVTLGTITTGTWNASVIPINKGGTGQISASAAINALLPTQSGNTDKFLKTNGTDVLWATPPSGSGEVQLSKTFTYDGDGRLSVITDSAGTKTLSYNLDGTLNQIVGTGPYVTKTFSYNLDGTLSGIAVS